MRATPYCLALIALILSACAAPRMYEAPQGKKTSKFTLVANSQDFVILNAVYYGNTEMCTDFQQIGVALKNDQTILLEADREHSIGVQANISSSLNSSIGLATFVHCNHYITFPVASGYEYRYTNKAGAGMCQRVLDRRRAEGGYWEPSPFRLRKLSEEYVRTQKGSVCLPE